MIRSSNRCGSLRSLPILHGRGGRDRAFPPCPPRLRWFDLPSPPSPKTHVYPLHVNILVSEARLSCPRARRDEEESQSSCDGEADRLHEPAREGRPRLEGEAGRAQPSDSQHRYRVRAAHLAYQTIHMQRVYCVFIPRKRMKIRYFPATITFTETLELFLSITL